MRSSVRSLVAIAGLGAVCACQMAADYAGTDYLCTAGECPDGFVCVAGHCRTGFALADGRGGADDAGDGDGDAGPTADLVVIEAEAFTANVMQGSTPWTANGTDGHSGAGAMLADGPGNSAIMWPDYYNQSSRLDYQVTLARSGVYQVWIRGMAWSGSDTCIPGLDGTGWAGSANPSGSLWVPVVTPTSWAWGRSDGLSGENVTVAAAEPGPHTFSIWMREDGIIVDKILLTTDPDYVPSGTGPPGTD